MNILGHHTPLKKKILRANNASQLENIWLKKLTNKSSLKAYKKQKIMLVDCIKKKEKCFFDDLNPSPGKPLENYKISFIRIREIPAVRQQWKIKKLSIKALC